MDDEILELKQRLLGQRVATSLVLHAIIESHPSRDAIRERLATLRSEVVGSRDPAKTEIDDVLRCALDPSAAQQLAGRSDPDR